MCKACLCLFLLVLPLTPVQIASSTTPEAPTVERRPVQDGIAVPLWRHASWRKAHPEPASGTATYPGRAAARHYLQIGTRSRPEVRVHFFRPNQLFRASPPPQP